MPKYLFAYHRGSMPEGEDERAIVMQAWNEWMAGLGGALIDGGNPVGMTKVVEADGEVDEDADDEDDRVTGYSIVTADSMDTAIELAKTCPQLAAGGHVEIGELIDVAAMAAEAGEAAAAE